MNKSPKSRPQLSDPQNIQKFLESRPQMTWQTLTSRAADQINHELNIQNALNMNIDVEFYIKLMKNKRHS